MRVGLNALDFGRVEDARPDQSISDECGHMPVRFPIGRGHIAFCLMRGFITQLFDGPEQFARYGRGRPSCRYELVPYLARDLGIPEVGWENGLDRECGADGGSCFLPAGDQLTYIGRGM